MNDVFGFGGEVNNFVAIPLFDEEGLSAFCKVFFNGVLGYDGEEVGIAILRAKDSSESLCLFLSRTKNPRDLDCYIGTWEIDRKVAHTGNDKGCYFSLAKLMIKTFSLVGWGLACDEGYVECLGDFFELFKEMPDDKNVFVLELFEEVGNCGYFVTVFGSNSKTGSMGGLEVGFKILRRKGNTDFIALGTGYPSFCLECFPSVFVDFGTDEGEDLSFLIVFSHEGCGETESAFSLDGGGESEDGCWKNVHLVVDDQSPLL